MKNESNKMQDCISTLNFRLIYFSQIGGKASILMSLNNLIFNNFLVMPNEMCIKSGFKIPYPFIVQINGLDDSVWYLIVNWKFQYNIRKR